MNLTVNNIDLFSLFISAGGLGFLTYNILAKTGKIYVRSTDQKDKYITLIFLSMLNYIIFLTVSLLVDYLNHYNFMENTKLLISILITLFFSVVLPTLIPITWFDGFTNILNKQRNKVGYANYYTETTRERFFNTSEAKSTFIFNFDNQLIQSGACYNVNESYKDDFELMLVPFSDETSLNDYDELMKYITNSDVDSEILINIDKQLKIIRIN